MDYSPRLTQMVSWCLLALSKTGRLIQVATGEGKSCIVAMFAAFRVKQGQNVDIITSSEVLAKRDLEEWKPFFEEMKITADCNTMKLDLNLKQCYKCKVVYGTVQQFAGDWLRQRFHRKNILGQRTFQCAIVDEVDSLMLDKGHHVVYLGTDMPALQHLNPLLVLIWATATQYRKISSEITVGKKHPFPHVLLENIQNTHVDEFSVLQMAEDTGILAKGCANQIRRDSSLWTQKMANVTVDQLVRFFEKAEMRFPFCRFSLHCINKNGKIEELNKRSAGQDGTSKIVHLLLRSGGLCQYMYPDEDGVKKAAEEEVKQSLCFTPCKVIHDKHICHIPSFFSKLVNSQLRIWIQNAFEAQTMTENDEYVIETHGIVPVDYSNTGVVENSTQWTDGLHQFLELKHGAKMSQMSIITNYKSSIGLFQMYGNQIYGMSGTLGQQVETEALQKIYKDINTCRIPTFRRRKLFEVEAKVVSNEMEWIETICDVVIEQTRATSFRGKRAALVICETINHAKTLEKALKSKGSKKLYINNNMDNEAVLKQKLEAGEVIVATNLAGRGTDLKVSESVKTAGGLFVIQTFLPRNARVEAQAFGRTARQGSPGSAQLIICTKHLSKLQQLQLQVKKLQSLFENMIDLTACFTSIGQITFPMLLMQYQNNSLQNPSMLKLALLPSLTENSVPEVKVVKESRDKSVAENLSTYLESAVPNIKKKEALFSQYLDVLDNLYRSADNKPAASDVSALNEFWGMWLITEYKDSECIESLKSKLAEDLSAAREKLNQRQSPLSNPHHCTAFGNELRKNGNLKGSIEMYSKAIQEDPCFAAVALYNRAFAYLAQQNGKQDHVCLTRALQDLQKALRSVQLYCEQTKVTRIYYSQSKHSPSNQLSRFDQQLVAREKVLQLFMSNINMAIIKLDRVSTFGGTVKVEEILLASAEDLLAVLVHGVESLFALRLGDHLRILQINSDPSLDVFNELRSLDSLGLTRVYSLDTIFSVGGFFSKLHRFITQSSK
ncbi:uncharacterized protein LOC115384198 isoform X2 [Salarias fasciatus]|nr:uncharacterized protein LOC115384198 isoform X2 [Salarias fasciatus]